MQSAYLLAARKIIRDAQENDISAIGIFEDFKVQGFPIVIPRFALVWAARREPQEPAVQQCLLRFMLDQELLNETPFNIDFEDQTIARVILNFTGMVIPRAGKLRVSIHHSEAEIAAAIMNIEANPGVPGAPPPLGATFLVA